MAKKEAVKLARWGGNSIICGDYKTSVWTKAGQYVVVPISTEMLADAKARKAGVWELQDGRPVELLSVNGGGEVRWNVLSTCGIPRVGSEDREAVDKFGLRLVGIPEDIQPAQDTKKTDGLDALQQARAAMLPLADQFRVGSRESFAFKAAYEALDACIGGMIGMSDRYVSRQFSSAKRLLKKAGNSVWEENMDQE